MQNRSEKRLLKVIGRLLLFDKKYWGYIYSFIVRQLKGIVNVAFDYYYCRESLGGTEWSKALSLQGVNATQSTDYFVLNEIFRRMDISKAEVLVDVGCGKGRVIIWWLKKGLKNKIYGIELKEDVAKDAAKRTERFDNVSIICGDAIENLPLDGTVFYLYNPFDERIVKRFKQKLEENFYKKKSITIVYFNCAHINLFQNDSKWEVDMLYMRFPFICKVLCISNETAIIRLKN